MGFHVLRPPIALRSSLLGFFSKSHDPLLPGRWVKAGECSTMRCFASATRGKNKKQRLDEACVERFNEYSRTLIQSWILQGKVLVDGRRVSKAGMPVSNTAAMKITAEVPKYVCSSGNLLCKVLHKESLNGPIWNVGYLRSSWFHSTPARETGDCVSKSDNSLSQDGVASIKLKRKKLKGKRAVVRWLKFFRWKKKKEFERMTAEEKILNKLRKARKKEERLMETMKKLEPSESAETTHDPEILTPEEHFYYLKMGLKCKNYVPVGRRGIYQGVILNMHLHWKKHQTLQVVIKTFTPDEVKEIAVELARLTGGIVLDIHEGNTIIMYRGKNYFQPPTEIMSPRITLPRKKALDKSKCRDALRAVRKYIPRLEQELQLLQAQAETKREYPNVKVDDTQESSEDLKKIIERGEECLEDEQEEAESELATDSDLSDIFETDSELEDEKAERPLFLEEFEKFPAINNKREDEDFDDPRKAKSEGEENDDKSPNFDEVDKMFLRAASLLKKKRR